MLEEAEATETATRTRRWTPCCSSDSRPPGRENAMWRGVLYEEEHLDAGIEGGVQLKSGTYVLVLGTNR